MKVFLGRMYRDIVRKIKGQAELQAAFSSELALAKRLLGQQRQDKNKLYSLHAPEVECIGKGKAHKKFEFGVKVSVRVTNHDNCIVGMQAEPGNPYNGHTLATGRPRKWNASPSRRLDRLLWLLDCPD